MVLLKELGQEEKVKGPAALISRFHCHNQQRYQTWPQHAFPFRDASTNLVMPVLFTLGGYLLPFLCRAVGSLGHLGYPTICWRVHGQKANSHFSAQKRIKQNGYEKLRFRNYKWDAENDNDKDLIWSISRSNNGSALQLLSKTTKTFGCSSLACVIVLSIEARVIKVLQGGIYLVCLCHGFDSSSMPTIFQPSSPKISLSRSHSEDDN